MTTKSPIILWLRRDLRLSDHPALYTAVQTGRPIIPVWIHDECVETLGAAPKWRMGLSVKQFATTLENMGSKLILRRGKAVDVLKGLVKETGATTVYWSRAYDLDAIERDTAVKTSLREMGLKADSFKGHLLFEPWVAQTKAGGFFKVYTPFWNCVRQIPVSDCLPAPTNIASPITWPKTDNIVDWEMGRAMNRGAHVVAKHVCVGEEAALDRLTHFIDTAVDRYKEDRDFAGLPATSRLSENLTYGEISPRVLYHAGRAAMERGAKGAEHFIKEVVWREFAYHLIYHTPQITTSNWRSEWDSFPWRNDNPDAELWRQGMTGEPFIDAGMRELYVTGIMHNRVRMLVGSYLTKHLMTHWKVGLDWFADTLIDWDPASNAMGWQWVAGCGPDAALYFRVFNPATQAEKFDGDRAYRDRFLPTEENSHDDGMSFYAAIPLSWKLDLGQKSEEPIISLKEGRERALAAYSAQKA
ncbi:deoxyribodipyrimidine photo-lyase [Amylibacter sp. SFDW26]|uniref:cryptochrome/photolyase family protein n=1 Tax=Amylibacter sp. SFDW26 TaxID=2652722 RepID=UPI001261F1B3|nr:deoxyribodipyrimidine photo-lyase [Amylibacter sp. SFDW26]KAB7616141.1 deoxyribodipyrimidine photo-lyase [Amylibacter sp. SFDW26]